MCRTGRMRSHATRTRSSPCTLGVMSPSQGDGTPTGTPALSRARRDFAERLAARPLLLDGAMGTLLFSRGIPQRASLDELVETHPDIVSAIHREYVAAGADIIETDSFG